MTRLKYEATCLAVLEVLGRLYGVTRHPVPVNMVVQCFSDEQKALSCLKRLSLNGFIGDCEEDYLSKEIVPSMKGEEALALFVDGYDETCRLAYTLRQERK